MTYNRNKSIIKLSLNQREPKIEKEPKKIFPK